MMYTLSPQEREEETERERGCVCAEMLLLLVRRVTSILVAILLTRFSSIRYSAVRESVRRAVVRRTCLCSSPSLPQRICSMFSRQRDREYCPCVLKYNSNVCIDKKKFTYTKK
jgi:hypothetical protein